MPEVEGQGRATSLACQHSNWPAGVIAAPLAASFFTMATFTLSAQFWSIMASIAPANTNIFPIAAFDGASPLDARDFTPRTCRSVAAILRRVPASDEE